MGERLEIRWARGPEDVSGAMAVREQVFCREQGVPREEELDAHDDHALHMLALDTASGRVVGTLRLLRLDDVAKVGRVAVERDRRGQGIASRMLALAIVRAGELGCSEVRLASQLHATGLYERAGFAVHSGVFEEAGIPHVWMSLPLEPAGGPDAGVTRAREAAPRRGS